MSVAIRAKSARARASEAIRQLTHRKELRRSFDDCFEMGDGDDVVKIIVQHAFNHPDFAAILRKRGYGYWLDPTYYERTNMTGRT